jgi:hypothetical protein
LNEKLKLEEKRGRNMQEKKEANTEKSKRKWREINGKQI